MTDFYFFKLFHNNNFIGRWVNMKNVKSWKQSYILYKHKLLVISFDYTQIMILIIDKLIIVQQYIFFLSL